MTKRKAKDSRPIAEDNPNTKSVLVYMPPELAEGLEQWAQQLNDAAPNRPKWKRMQLIVSALAWCNTNRDKVQL